MQSPAANRALEGMRDACRSLLSFMRRLCVAQRQRASFLTRLLALRAACIFCALMLPGCSNNTPVGWRHVDPATPVKSHDLVWIWSRAGTNKWYAVVVTPDSVSGIPFEMPLTCDSCRRSLPRSQVDSMQVAYKIAQADSKMLGEVAGAIGAVLLIEMVICTAARAHSC